jgi:hypothetical protein
LHISKKYCNFARRHHFPNFETRIRSKSIPFSIQAKNEEEDEVTAKAKAAFKQLRAKAERGETPELTLDEINEEIREVRRLRKERNGICVNQR